MTEGSSSTPRVVTIPDDEYHRLTTMPFSSTATFAQKGSSYACLASNTQWVIDSGVSDHMTGVFTILSGSRSLGKFPHVTLADGSTADVTGLSNAT